MNVVVLDDERIILESETVLIKDVLTKANVFSFKNAKDLLNYAKENRIDIAFLDINLGESFGIDIAKKLQDYNPRVNIIFCTGYSDYALDSMKLYASAYLLKPLTEESIKEATSKLRYEIIEEINNKLIVKCFGNFEVLYNNEPIKFKYSKTKELFAYLVDRKGVIVNTNEIMSALFEEDNKGSYLRNLKVDLINTFEELGIDNILIQQKGKIGLHIDLIDCDYFDYLNGSKDIFKGEYMSQYSFGEITQSFLQEK